MLLALSCNVLLGLAWTLVAVGMSRVARQQQPIFAFYAAGYGLAALVAWVVFANWGELLAGNVARALPTVLWAMFGGAATAISSALLVAAMRRGPKGITWTFGQSAMVMPYTAGIVIWGENPGWPGWPGIVAIITALVFFGWRRQGDVADRQPGWLPLVLITFTILGLAQTSFGVMSRWDGWQDTAGIRSPVALTTSFLVHLMTSTVRRQRPRRSMFVPLIIWATGALGAYFLAFKSLDLLATYDLAAIVYPVGVATSMAVFCLYSVLFLGEKMSRRRLTGLLLALTGVVFLALARGSEGGEETQDRAQAEGQEMPLRHIGVRR